MTLLTSQARISGKPAVHALVVAVGRYPHLENGKGPKLLSTGGLGQLSSPPVSATALCDWLLKKFAPKARELGSIEVLSSGTTKFTDEAGAPCKVKPATLANVQEAAQAWYTRANANPDNLLLFYFCGHGVSSGDVHSLLLEDFGAKPLDPFNSGAIDAEAFMDGLLCRCEARSQLFLFDACRTVDHQSFGNLGPQRGIPIVSGGTHNNLGATQQACLWATQLGTSAFGRKNRESVFMEAMLKAMSGAGCMQDPNDASWVIQPDMLKRGIDVFVQRAMGFAAQYVTVDRLAEGFPLHVLPGEPVLPVKVICKPEPLLSQRELRCSSGDVRPVGNPEPWYLDLPNNQYLFEAVAPGNGVVASRTQHTTPPLTVVSLSE